VEVESKLMLASRFAFPSACRSRRPTRKPLSLEQHTLDMDENQKGHLTCLGHYLDLFHLCNGKTIDTQDPINHTKLLRKWGYKFKHFV
jgi:hypothetical protein